jgi:sulfate adenylyltransferase
LGGDFSNLSGGRQTGLPQFDDVSSGRLTFLPRFPNFAAELWRRRFPAATKSAQLQTELEVRMADLIPPHGGLTEPVCCTVSAGEIDRFKAEAAKLPKVPVSAADLSTVYRFGDGTLSPLTGPMNSKVYYRVLDEAVIEHSGKKYAWTIPLAFPVTAALAKTLSAGTRVALTNPAGEVVATLEINDVFEWDKPRYIKSVYLTERTDHPGADMVLKGDADKTHLIGGEIRVLPQPKNARFGKYVLTPREVRKLLAEKGWNAVVAFQTRNPLHRAHEYALVYGLETLLRDGKNAGAVLNPLIGETKGDDVNAEIRMRTYEKLIEQRELGDGDSDAALWKKVGGSVPDRVLLLGLDIKMFYGGPKEAVMHSIYRQNMGYTHIVIGRKHADAPFADGTPIWGDFDAQEIFGKLGGDLKIQPVKVGFAAYYDSMGRVDLMQNHQDEKPVFISGKDVRATLLKGAQVDPRIMRPSTSQILGAAMKQG